TNPNDVRTDFAASLADVAAFHATANAALTGDKDKTFLVEHTFLAAAVLWEGFISDLLVAYINRDATRFRTHLKDALETTLTAMIAIRNHIAHRSKRSGQAMNDALAKGALHGTGLGRGGPNAVNHVGSFLKSKPAGKQMARIDLYLSALGPVAAAL